MALQKVKALASQADSIYKYKNIKTKLSQCRANIYFNKQCLIRNNTPAYAKIKIPHTSQATTVTQRKTRTLCIKDEIRFLYRKKDYLNRQLYQAHLQTANQWGSSWNIISKTIQDNTNITMGKKYLSLNQKLQQLSEQKVNTYDTTPFNFYPRVVNLTNITFTEHENRLLQTGLKYNLHTKPKQWLKTLAIEAETAISLIPAPDQEAIQYLIAQNLEKLHRNNNHKISSNSLALN
jgi:hypothetical protein